MRGTFSNLLSENLVKFLEEKPMEAWLHFPPSFSPKEFLTLMPVTASSNPSELSLRCSVSLWLQVTDLSCDSLYPQIWRRGRFLCHFSSLMGPVKIIDFSLCPAFSGYKDKSDDFQALYIFDLGLEVFHTIFSLLFT